MFGFDGLESQDEPFYKDASSDDSENDDADDADDGRHGPHLKLST